MLINLVYQLRNVQDGMRVRYLTAIDGLYLRNI